MIYIPGLTDAMLDALADISAQSQTSTASARALVRKGLAQEWKSKEFTLTEYGKVAWRCMTAEYNTASDFTIGETVDYPTWILSRGNLELHMYRGVIARWAITNANDGLTNARFEVDTEHHGTYRLHASQLLKVEQPAPSPPAVHPVIDALRKLDVNALEPIGALSKLYELKRMATE